MINRSVEANGTVTFICAVLVDVQSYILVVDADDALCSGDAFAFRVADGVDGFTHAIILCELDGGNIFVVLSARKTAISDSREPPIYSHSMA